MRNPFNKPLDRAGLVNAVHDWTASDKKHRASISIIGEFEGDEYDSSASMDGTNDMLVNMICNMMEHNNMFAGVILDSANTYIEYHTETTSDNHDCYDCQYRESCDGSDCGHCMDLTDVKPSN